MRFKPGVLVFYTILTVFQPFNDVKLFIQVRLIIDIMWVSSQINYRYLVGFIDNTTR